MADLKEEVFNLVDAQPERMMQIVAIQDHIREQFIEHHAGEIRYAIRMLLDEGRARLNSGNILVLN